MRQGRRHGTPRYGTEKSKGTKVFALAGAVNNTGLVEVPVGTPLGELIYDVGGGILGNKAFKAAQIGGPSGGCIPRQHLNVPLDYESLHELGAIMGSGGLIVMDEDTCMVDVARFFLEFVQDESCGKCVPCRVGTKRMLEILEPHLRRQGRGGRHRAARSRSASRSRTPRSAASARPRPTRCSPPSAISAHEYEAHIRDKHCEAGVCAGLVRAPVPERLPGRRSTFRVSCRWSAKNAMPRRCGSTASATRSPRSARGSASIPARPSAAAPRLTMRYRSAASSGSWSTRKSRSRCPKCANRRPMPRGRSRSSARVRLDSPAPTSLPGSGYRPTVFEAEPRPGGMLVQTIPSYRLPREILAREVRMIERMGVEIVTGMRLGRDITLAGSARAGGYEAVFLGVGAQQPVKLGIPGEKRRGVVDALAFLRQYNLRGSVPVGKEVVVVGGGNAAIDAARTAIRLGAKNVTIVYRRTREEMPAYAEEIEEAKAEGVS